MNNYETTETTILNTARESKQMQLQQEVVGGNGC